MKLIAACIVSFLITLVTGRFLLPELRRLKAGQSIREDGPTWHAGKSGTPTMGGLMFIFGILVSLGNLSQHIVKNILLRFGHTIENIIYGLVRRSLSRCVRMRKDLILSVFTRVNNSLFLCTSVGMLEHY